MTSITNPSSINDQLLLAVAEDRPYDIQRLLEIGGAEWLDLLPKDHDDHTCDPVWHAIRSPLGIACLEVFQRWFGDVEKWSFHGWQAIHWAVADKNEALLRFLFKEGADLTDRESPDPKSFRTSSESTVTRSAFQIAALTADIDWFDHVLALALEHNTSLEKLIAEDRRSKVSAVGMCCHQKAMQDRADQQGTSLHYEAMARHLVQLGFPVDSHKTPSAKISGALSLNNPEDPLNARYAAAINLAWELTCQPHPHSGSVYAGAGRAIDVTWYRMLVACGIPDPNHDFASSAAHVLKNEITHFIETGRFPSFIEHHRDSSRVLLVEFLQNAPHCSLSPEELAFIQIPSKQWGDDAGVALLREKLQLSACTTMNFPARPFGRL